MEEIKILNSLVMLGFLYFIIKELDRKVFSSLISNYIIGISSFVRDYFNNLFFFNFYRKGKKQMLSCWGIFIGILITVIVVIYLLNELVLVISTDLNNCLIEDVIFSLLVLVELYFLCNLISTLINFNKFLHSSRQDKWTVRGFLVAGLKEPLPKKIKIKLFRKRILGVWARMQRGEKVNKELEKKKERELKLLRKLRWEQSRTGMSLESNNEKCQLFKDKNLYKSTLEDLKESDYKEAYKILLTIRSRKRMYKAFHSNRRLLKKFELTLGRWRRKFFYVRRRLKWRVYKRLRIRARILFICLKRNITRYMGSKERQYCDPRVVERYFTRRMIKIYNGNKFIIKKSRTRGWFKTILKFRSTIDSERCVEWGLTKNLKRAEFKNISDKFRRFLFVRKKIKGGREEFVRLFEELLTEEYCGYLNFRRDWFDTYASFVKKYERKTKRSIWCKIYPGISFEYPDYTPGKNIMVGLHGRPVKEEDNVSSLGELLCLEEDCARGWKRRRKK